MASQSLYRKWRSQTFSDLIGQEAITRTLLNAVREGRLAHAYLFCGPRGTGKTSTARLLAKAINCANPQNGEPCNECVSCREIAAGNSPDVIEIDAASNNGVDNIRDLRENAGLLAGNGHHKVYVVDECHMLSPQAFNALLKTLEEPPPHVIFVLATTESQKVLPTVVSRCQRFDFRRITGRDIVARLNHVAEGEGLELEPAAAELLARAAQGGLRDALSLLDQAMAYCGTRIDLARTREMLGLSDTGTLRAILRAVADENAAEGLELIHSLVTAGADLRQVQQQMAEEWRALMLARAGADLARVLDCSEDEAREIADLAQAFSLDELMACARVFARNETPARGLPVPQLALEIALLECVSIRANRGQPAQPAATLPTRAASPERAPAAARPAPAPYEGNGHVADRTASASSLSPSLRPVPAAPQEPTRHEATRAVDREVEPEIAGPTLRLVPPPPATPEEEDTFAGPEAWDDAPSDEYVEAAMPAQSGGNAAALINTVRQEWEMIRKVCKQKSAKVAGLLNDAAPTRVDDGAPPLLVIHAQHEFHFTSLRKPESTQVVEWAIEQVTERQMRVRFELAGNNDTGGGSPGRGPRTQPSGGPGGSSQRGPNGSGAFGTSSYGANGASGATRAGMNGANGSGGAIREASATMTAGPGAKPAYSSPAGANGANGANGATSAAASMPNAATSAARSTATLTESRPAEPRATPAPARNAESARGGQGQAALEAEVRADPLVQELMRVCHVELAEVHPLDADEESGETR